MAVQINQNSEQLVQNQELTRSGLVSNLYDAWITIDTSDKSETFAETLGKSLEQPQELTVAEMIELDGYYFALLDQVQRNQFLNQNGVFREGFENAIPADAFGSSYAQAWWAENRQGYNPQIVDAMDRQLLNISNNSRMEYYQRVQARLSQ